MTRLLFVRHGQASFGAANYDVLSDAGRLQAQLLGRWLASHPEYDFDHVACGTLVRQQDTLAQIRVAFDAVDRTLPHATVLDALNEFDHRAVFNAFAQTHADHESVRASHAGRSTDPHAVARFLREGLLAWTRGTLDAQVPEPWLVFRQRIRDLAAQLTTHPAHPARVLVVTSGGVMSQLAQLALGAPDSTAVELNLNVRNSALAEFHSQQGNLSLSSWNALPHLASAEHHALWTYY